MGGVVVFSLLSGGAFAWGVQRVSQERAARVEALGPLLTRATALESLNPQDACIVVEGYFLKREKVLTTRCGTVALESTRPGVMSFRGLVVSDRWADALTDGGYVPTVCLAKSAQGWVVAGYSHDLLECQFDAPTGPDPVKEAQAQVEHLKRAWIDDAFAAVRVALTRPPSDKEVCEGLPTVSKWGVMVLDADLLAEDRSARMKRTTRYGDVLGFQCIPEMTDGKGANLGPCAAYHRITHVVAFDEIDEPALEVTGSTYRGGRYAAVVKLVDVRKQEVLCQRAVSFQLPEDILLVKRQSLQSEYRKQVNAALHESVAKLTGGKLELDF
ncbi:hypothetical protein LZ198_26220 [Myxococcus sp. K15C18031901]|nr:hypothetical protein [Myxococcus dinghuensis]